MTRARWTQPPTPCVWPFGARAFRHVEKSLTWAAAVQEPLTWARLYGYCRQEDEDTMRKIPAVMTLLQAATTRDRFGPVDSAESWLVRARELQGGSRTYEIVRELLMTMQTWACFADFEAAVEEKASTGFKRGQYQPAAARLDTVYTKIKSSESSRNRIYHHSSKHFRLARS